MTVESQGWEILRAEGKPPIGGEPPISNEGEGDQPGAPDEGLEGQEDHKREAEGPETTPTEFPLPDLADLKHGKAELQELREQNLSLTRELERAKGEASNTQKEHIGTISALKREVLILQVQKSNELVRLLTRSAELEAALTRAHKDLLILREKLAEQEAALAQLRQKSSNFFVPTTQKPHAPSSAQKKLKKEIEDLKEKIEAYRCAETEYQQVIADGQKTQKKQSEELKRLKINIAAQNAELSQFKEYISTLEQSLRERSALPKAAEEAAAQEPAKKQSQKIVDLEEQCNAENQRDSKKDGEIAVLKKKSEAQEAENIFLKGMCMSIPALAVGAAAYMIWQSYSQKLGVNPEQNSVHTTDLSLTSNMVSTLWAAASDAIKPLSIPIASLFYEKFYENFSKETAASSNSFNLTDHITQGQAYEREASKRLNEAHKVNFDLLRKAVESYLAALEHASSEDPTTNPAPDAICEQFLKIIDVAPDLITDACIEKISEFHRNIKPENILSLYKKRFNILQNTLTINTTRDELERIHSFIKTIRRFLSLPAPTKNGHIPATWQMTTFEVNRILKEFHASDLQALLRQETAVMLRCQQIQVTQAQEKDIFALFGLAKSLPEILKYLIDIGIDEKTGSWIKTLMAAGDERLSVESRTDFHIKEAREYESKASDILEKTGEVDHGLYDKAVKSYLAALEHVSSEDPTTNAAPDAICERFLKMMMNVAPNSITDACMEKISEFHTNIKPENILSLYGQRLTSLLLKIKKDGFDLEKWLSVFKIATKFLSLPKPIERSLISPEWQKSTSRATAILKGFNKPRFQTSLRQHTARILRDKKRQITQAQEQDIFALFHETKNVPEVRKYLVALGIEEETGIRIETLMENRDNRLLKGSTPQATWVWWPSSFSSSFFRPAPVENAKLPTVELHEKALP
jgi:hypothetical protein